MSDDLSYVLYRKDPGEGDEIIRRVFGPFEAYSMLPAMRLDHPTTS